MPPPGKEYADQADTYKQQYDQLLEVAIKLSNGVIPLSVLESGQFYSQYTEEAERLAQLNTGITINSQLTRMTYDIEPCSADYTATNKNEQDVFMLNQNLLNLTTSFVQFQADLLNKRVSCGLFTMMYTADILHILMEAKRYLEILKRLQNRDESLLSDYKLFWSQNMADHAKVMRGQLDPTETAYFNTANQFSNTFDLLSAAEMKPETFPSDREILSDVIAISDFKSDTTNGLITCKVQAIMLALYTDHLLREANHFIYLMYAGS